MLKVSEYTLDVNANFTDGHSEAYTGSMINPRWHGKPARQSRRTQVPSLNFIASSKDPLSLGGEYDI